MLGKSRRRGTPQLSIIVVNYDLERELPRTLETLGAPYQRGVTAAKNTRCS